MVLARAGGVRHPIEVEVFGVVQVGETALDQGADEVERQRGPLVAAEQELGVGSARGGGELGPVDDISPIRGEADAVTGFLAGGARLGILSGEAPDAGDRPSGDGRSGICVASRG